MKTKIIEAGQSTEGPNWGKFLLGRLDVEWQVRSGLELGGEGSYDPGSRPHCRPLLAQIGWGPEHLWVLDLQTGEGAFFRPGGLASADLAKHKIWVCPMFEPFLGWLYQQDLSDLDALPSFVSLPEAPFDFHGHRRPGP